MLWILLINLIQISFCVYETHTIHRGRVRTQKAERRLSPDYNRYEKALQCTTKTHRCLHAAHAYTGIPCAAYSEYSFFLLFIFCAYSIGYSDGSIIASSRK